MCQLSPVVLLVTSSDWCLATQVFSEPLCCWCSAADNALLPCSPYLMSPSPPTKPQQIEHFYFVSNHLTAAQQRICMLPLCLQHPHANAQISSLSVYSYNVIPLHCCACLFAPCVLCVPCCRFLSLFPLHTRRPHPGRPSTSGSCCRSPSTGCLSQSCG